MIMFPPCKINLGLNVISKREDGYHELESVLYQLPITDLLEIVPSSKFSFQSSGLEIPGDLASNLCVKAYQLLQKEFKLDPVSMHLHKIIPMGAGLGGGSSDGTYTLLLLNDLFDLNVSPTQLEQYALQLGSDCPLFVTKNCKLASGRGEILTPIDLNLSSHFISIIHPGIHVSTKDAFGALTPKRAEEPISERIKQPMETWKKNLKNDFELPIFNLYPELEHIKNKLYEQGAIYASMSGSGSSIFGIFNTETPPILDFQKKNYYTQTTFID